MASVRVRLSPGFLPGAGFPFPGEHVFADFQVLQRKLEPGLSSLTSLSQILFRAGFPEEHVFRGFSGAPAETRTTLVQPHFTSRGNGAASPEF
jgi:hypothetical protein